MAGQTTPLRAQCAIPGARVRLGGAVRASPSVARHLPTDRRGRTPQASRDATNRSTRSNPARNFLPLIERQRNGTAPAGYRGDASRRRQDVVDRALGPLQQTGDIARALTTLPTFPKFSLLLRRQPRASN